MSDKKGLVEIQRAYRPITHSRSSSLGLEVNEVSQREFSSARDIDARMRACHVSRIVPLCTYIRAGAWERAIACQPPRLKRVGVKCFTAA